MTCVLLTGPPDRTTFPHRRAKHIRPFSCLGVWEMGELAQWLSAARAGSREALGQALDACRQYLLIVARRELDPELQAKGSASDLGQETFLEAHRDFGQFQGGSADELRAWLRQLLLHNLANFARSYRG